ncbi:MAG: hypothetical protein ABJA74_13485 [Lapillicoccus sp.]
MRSFFVRITVRPSGSVRRVGWPRTEELGRLSARPVVIRSSFCDMRGAPLVRRQDECVQILTELSGYSQSRRRRG